MNSSLSFAKVWFGLSLLVLAFGYGFASHAWGVFPKTFVETAWRQAYWRVQAEKKNTPSLTDQIYDRKGWESSSPESMSPGMTLITSSWKKNEGWKVGPKLFDESGEIVHEWLFDRKKVFGSGLVQRRDPESTDIQGSLLLSNGDVVVNLEYVGMARLNSCGKVLWTLTESNHHSIAHGRNGSFWVPGASQEKRSKSDQYPEGFPGLDGKKVWVDRILRVSGEGEILYDANVLDILYANGLERYIPKVLGGKRPSPKKITSDVTHINDIEPLSPSMADEYPLFESGDLLVSARSLSLVFVVDPDTKEVKWHSSDPFVYQHDPDFIGGGWIGVFDNNYDLTSYNSPDRGTMLGGSRIVYIEPHTDSTKVQFPTQHSELLYTHVRGKWQGLNNGNMLLTEAQAGRAVEVNSEGRTVWEWIHKPTDNSKVPSVTKATRHDLTREEIASWPCSSVDSVSASAQNTSTQNQQTAP